MTRLAWLILGWGIIALTVIDGAYSVRINSYAVNEYAHSADKNNNNFVRFNGPVFTLLAEGFDDIEGFVDKHEKLLIVLSSIPYKTTLDITA